MLQFSILTLTHSSFERCRVPVQSLTHATPNNYLVEKIRWKLPCGDLRHFDSIMGFVDGYFHTVPKGLVSLDIPRRWLRWHTHGSRLGCNSHGGNTFQNFCNKANDHLLCIFHCSLQRRTLHTLSPANGRIIFNRTFKMKYSSWHRHFFQLCFIVYHYEDPVYHNALKLNKTHQLHDYADNLKYLETTIVPQSRKNPNLG
jgi:hypothetical protein